MEKLTAEQYTEDVIRHKLATDERWVRRALIRLYQRQTQEEKQVHQTRNHNLRGFQPTDARWFSRLAEFVIKNPNKPLSEKQLLVVWRPWRDQPAICKYARQILKIIQEDGNNNIVKTPVNNCKHCGENLPGCRCAYKAAYAQQEARMERVAYMRKYFH